jgi:hypothetical protein
MRLAVENWSQEEFKRPVTTYLREAFENLKDEI